MKRLFRLTIALAALSATASMPRIVCHAADVALPRADRPNIVFILADDLGYGDLGCYGQKHIKTPNIDRLAAEGIRFTQFYAGSTVCAPSRCVLMTGLHTGHAHIRGNARTNLRPEDVTVAEVLKDAGYATGLVGKWGLGIEGQSGIPTRQGFDYFFGYLDQTHAHNYYPAFLHRNESRVPLKNVVPNSGAAGQGVASKRVEYSHDVLAADALDFIDRTKDKPFFLYLALTIPHANNEAGKDGMEVPELGEYQDRDWPASRKAHAAMISRMDRDVGRVIERLKKHGIDDRTIVFFSSDNGPHKEGGFDPAASGSSGPLRGIKRDLYEGGIRVPMIVRWPGAVKAGHVKPGSTSQHVGYFADFLPTAAELCAAKTPDKLDGISIAPTLLGQPDKQRSHEYLYWEFYEGRGARAVRLGNYKGVCAPFGGPIATSRPMELYDLATDLGEQHNIADKHPDVAAKIREIMAAAHAPSPLWKVGYPGGQNPKGKKTAADGAKSA